MDTNDALVTIFEWSDKSRNAFMSHDKKAIKEFLFEKQNRFSNITYVKKEMTMAKYSEERGV
jgi:hypothetical protein